MKSTKVVLLLLLLVSAAKATHYYKRPTLNDFKVYITAATLVQEHRSLLIYDGADTGRDPQLRFAEPQSIFAQEAAKIGINKVCMYVYPPLLADLLEPLSYLTFPEAGRIWTTINVVMLLAVCWLCMQFLNIPVTLPAAGAVVLGVATFFPVLSCVYWGQIVIVLLGLWTFGVYAYSRGWVVASAFALALAACIKLTPLLVIVPFLLWKEWRWIRAFAVSVLALVAGIWLVNGSACLQDFVTKVMPSMSNGNPDGGNRSIINCLQYFYVAVRHLPASAFSPTVGAIGKLLALLLIVTSGVYVARYRALATMHERIVVLSIFSLLSVLASPVSWEHAFSMALLTLIVLWAEALRQRVPPAYLALLAVASFELNGFKISYLLRNGSSGIHYAMAMSIPVVLGVTLVLYRLAAMPRFSLLRAEGLPAERALATA